MNKAKDLAQDLIDRWTRTAPREVEASRHESRKIALNLSKLAPKLSSEDSLTKQYDNEVRKLSPRQRMNYLLGVASMGRSDSIREKLVHFLVLNGGKRFEETITETIHVDLHGFGIDLTEDSIIFVGDEGEFGRVPLNFYSLVGFLIHHRMIAANYKHV
jgi:hypothetical protein